MQQEFEQNPDNDSIIIPINSFEINLEEEIENLIQVLTDARSKRQRALYVKPGAIIVSLLIGVGAFYYGIITFKRTLSNNDLGLGFSVLGTFCLVLALVACIIACNNSWRTKRRQNPTSHAYIPTENLSSFHEMIDYLEIKSTNKKGEILPIQNIIQQLRKQLKEIHTNKERRQALLMGSADKNKGTLINAFLGVCDRAILKEIFSYDDRLYPYNKTFFYKKNNNQGYADETVFLLNP